MGASSDTRTITLTIPARPDYVVLARLALAAVCARTALEPNDVADLKLAITEGATAFVNERSPHRLTFTFLIKNDLVVEIGGPPTVGPDHEDGDLSRSIIDATVDGSEWEGDMLRLRKALPGRAPIAAE